MAKWADYLISEVQYDGEHSHIIKVKTHEDKGDKVGSGFEEKRETIISKLKNKKYNTIIKGQDGWTNGQKVGIIEVKGEEYIRTDKNETENDNLGNLPEF